MNRESSAAEDYGTLSEITDNLDELIAETSLGASKRKFEHRKTDSEFSRFDDLFVPIPDVMELSRVKHEVGQTRGDSKDESEQVDDAISLVDQELEKRREELGTQLASLGFHDWKDRVEEYKKQNKDINVEDLIFSDYSEWVGDLNSRSFVKKLRAGKLDGKRFGGALSNLQRDLDEWYDLSAVGSLFSVFTGHKTALKTNVESSKNIVRSRLKTIKEFSEALRSTRQELSIVNQRKVDRNKAVEIAHDAYESGDIEKAQIYSIKADSITEVIKTRLLNANELSAKSHLVDYSKLMHELAISQERWKKTDASYGKTLIAMEAISKAAIVGVSVTAGMIFLPGALGLLATYGIGTGVLSTFLTSAGLTTLIGGILSYGRTTAQGISSEAQGVDFDWDEQFTDAWNTTGEIGLMGVGGGMVSGGKIALGIGLNSARITAGAGKVARVISWVKGAADSSVTAMGISLPSSVWGFRNELIQANQLVDQKVDDGRLDYDEIQFIESRKDSLDGERKLGDYHNSDNFEPEDKELYRRMLKRQNFYNLLKVYGGDMAMNALCGAVGHTASGFRANHLKSLMPKAGSANAGFKAAVGRQAANVNILSLHAVDLLMSKVAADINIGAREAYLGQVASEEDIIRIYCQALTSDLVGAAQGEVQARTQVMAENFRADAKINIDKAVDSDLKKLGVKVEQEHNVELKHQAESGFDGENHIIGIGDTLGDAKLAQVFKALHLEDSYRKLSEKATGSIESTKLIREEINKALKHMNEQTSYPKEFKEAIHKKLTELFIRDNDRQGRITVEGAGQDKDLAKLQLEVLLEHSKQVSAETEFNYTRYIRGAGKDKIGPLNIAKKVSEFLGIKFKNPLPTVKTFFTNGVTTPVSRVVRGVLNLPVIGTGFRGIGMGLRGIGNILRFPYLASRRVFVEAPFLKALVVHSGLGSASAVSGVGGVAAIWAGSIGLTKHLGFYASRKLGLNSLRPLDSADAYSGKLQLEKTLHRLKSIEPAEGQVTQVKKTVKLLEAQIKKMNTMLSECSQPRRNYLLNLGGMGYLAAVGNPGGVIALGLYSCRKILGTVPTTILGLGYMGAAPLFGLPSLGLATTGFATAALALGVPYGVYRGLKLFPAARLKAADACDYCARKIMSEHGFARFMRGESRIHSWAVLGSSTAILGGVFLLSSPVSVYTLLIPLGFQVWKTQGGNTARYFAGSLLQSRNSLSGKQYYLGQEHRYTPEMFADLQNVWWKGLSNGEGRSATRMFKAVEQKLVGELKRKSSNVKHFARTLETLINETNPTIRAQILYRLKVVAGEDPSTQNAKTDSAKLAQLKKDDPEAYRKKIEKLKKKEQNRKGANERRKADLAKLKNDDPEAYKKKIAELKEAEKKRNKEFKSAFLGIDPSKLDDGGYEAYNRDIAPEKRKLLDDIISEINKSSAQNKKPDFDTILSPHRAKGKPALSSYEIYKSNLDDELRSVVYGIENEGTYNVRDLESYLSIKELTSTFSEIEKRFGPIVNEKSSMLDGELVFIAKKELELREEAKKIELKSSKEPDVAKKAELGKNSQELWAKASQLKEVRKKLEEYILERKNLNEFILGQEKTESLRVMQKVAMELKAKAKAKAKWPKGITSQKEYDRLVLSRVGQKAKAKAKEASSSVNENAAKLPKPEEFLTRKEQRERLIEINERLSRLSISDEEKIKLLTEIETRLESEHKEKIKDLMEHFLEDPTNNAPGRLKGNAYMRALAEKARNGLEPITVIDADGKQIVVESKKIDANFRAKLFIEDPSRDFAYREVKSNFQEVKDFMFLKDRRMRERANRSRELGIYSYEDINNLVKALIDDPNSQQALSSKGLSEKMRTLAKKAGNEDLTAAQRQQAEVDLKKLIGQDFNEIINVYKAQEKKRIDIGKDIEEIIKDEYENNVGRTETSNLERRKEMLTLARNKINRENTNWAIDKNHFKISIPFTNIGIKIPRFIKNWFAISTVRIKDESPKLRSIWDIEQDSMDYKGYSAKDRISSKMPSEYISLDTSFKPTRPEAYSDNLFYSLLGGPIDLRHGGMYADSSVLRFAAFAWRLRRLGMR